MDAAKIDLERRRFERAMGLGSAQVRRHPDTGEYTSARPRAAWSAWQAAVAAERHGCENVVFAVRLMAERPDAPDHGVSGWLQEAEAAIRARVDS